MLRIYRRSSNLHFRFTAPSDRALSFSSRSTIPLSHHLPLPQHPTRHPSLTRQLHQTPACYQHAAAQSAPSDETVQAGDDIMGKRQVHNAPLTSFRQLADRTLVHEAIVQNITHKMGLSSMTPVQSMTVSETLGGADVLAQAKTGTGKTLAFLIPVLNNILRHDPSLAQTHLRRRVKATDIRAIIISPTRELAEQIAAEARRVTEGLGVVVQIAVGGTAKRSALTEMQRRGCHLLVATPGRLKDILSDPRSGVDAPDLQNLVLDEADRLLDQGFSQDLLEIMGMLPDKTASKRQTLMFSATVPQEVMQMVRQTMQPTFHFLRTVEEGETPTLERVPQKLVAVRGWENMLPTLLELCSRQMAASHDDMPFKAIVYLNATANVGLAASTFRNLRPAGAGHFGNKHPLHPTEIIEMHARLSQAQRTRNSEQFRNATNAILFSSDVTARGMDFPNVTHVIQLGAPPERESYVHRIGRTARGNKDGEGWLFASEVEMSETRKRLKGLPLRPDTSLGCAGLDMSQPANVPDHVAENLTAVGEASKLVSSEDKSKAFLAYLGSYGFLDRRQLLESLNRLSQYGWGMSSPPSIPPMLVRKLGLTRLAQEGLLTVGEARSASSRSDGPRGGGRPGFGSGPRRSSREEPRPDGFTRRSGGAFTGARGRESRGRDGRQGGRGGGAAVGREKNF
ncbi:MAG: hypothetical protein M1817_002045 [Caeruleum heppii]|nr:MAG: hypothetical protein M1817_002045 [Caeruleum heppii]